MSGVERSGLYFGIPLSIWVIGFLAAGLVTGAWLPHSSVATALYATGAYFPKAVVTLAALIIFLLLGSATAKLVLFHRERAGRLFGMLLALYVVLGLFSLLYVAAWLSLLARLPLTLPGIAISGATAWARQVERTFSDLLREQPLFQALLAGMGIGYAAAAIPALHPVAHGLVRGGEATLKLFRKLLWYYPFMIGCLAIGIPMKFGISGVGLYGRTVVLVALVTTSLSALVILLAKTATKRSWKQIFSYYGAVWPTGFGTGGSYETLPVNIVSAEQDLGLPAEVAEVSIVFGTVLNKSCSTVSVLLVSVTVCKLLHLSISLIDVFLLVPPLLILGLESPGIPGGAAFFMSPIVAVILKAPNTGVFVATFVSVFSGLIPMLNTAGNTTTDGIIGALLNDRFPNVLHRAVPPPERQQGGGEGRPAAGRRGGSWGPRAWIAWPLLAAGTWMMVSPQAQLGLKQLEWMHDYAFPGEALPGALLLSLGLYFLGKATSS